MENLSSFRELGLSEVTLQALAEKGFETPTEIQQLAIPRLLSSTCGLIGQANTGTGKTAAFGLPVLELLEKSKTTQALIIAPTRELCCQIADEMESLKGERDLRILPVYGGQSIDTQLQKLKKGAEIIVGTPGRLLDLLRREALKLGSLKFAVLDEADEMLDMGFVDDIRAILECANPDKRMLMFSATMPPEIMEIAETFMPGFELLKAGCAGEELPDATEQIYYELKREDKFAALCRLIDVDPNMSALVFCRTRGDVDELTEKLNFKGYRGEALHGDIAQAQRTRVINQFKEHRFKLLIATDVAARGIDVNDLSHVINYSLPLNAQIYIHRIGRTGRAGKKGVAVTFVTPAEKRRLELIKREAKASALQKAELPQPPEIVRGKKQQVLESLIDLMMKEQHIDYREFAGELLLQSKEPADMIAALLKLHFGNELLESSYAAIGAKRKRDRKSWEEESGDEFGVRLFIGVGKNDGFGAVKMLDLIWELSRIKKARVGKIDCYDNFSFVNLEHDDAASLIAAGRRHGIKIQQAQDTPQSRVSADRTPPESRRRSRNTEPSDRKFAGERTADRKPARERSAAPADRKPAKAPREKAPTPSLRDWVNGISGEVPIREKRRKKK